jgi:hypothetical protein
MSNLPDIRQPEKAVDAEYRIIRFNLAERT